MTRDRPIRGQELVPGDMIIDTFFTVIGIVIDTVLHPYTTNVSVLWSADKGEMQGIRVYALYNESTIEDWGWRFFTGAR